MGKRNIITLLLALFLAIQPGTAALAQENEETQGETETTYTLAGLEEGSMASNWEDNLFFKRREEKTGVSFSFQQFYDASEWNKKKSAYLSGEEAMPDGLLKAGLTPQEEIEGYQKGLFMDLKPMLEEHAPTLYQLLQDNPEWEKAIALPTGEIVSLPHIDLLRTQNAMWINTGWLKALNLTKPTTKAELEAVLLAFKDQDPNQNGKKDEVPFAFIGPWDLKFLSHAFGDIANDYNIFVDEKDQVQFYPVSESYYNLVLWLRDLYEQKLLDKDGFSQTDQMRSMAKEESPTTYGIIMGPTPYTSLPNAHAKQYELLLPLLDDEGNQTYRDFIGPVAGGTFAISAQCKNPEKLIEWIDYLYTQEGAILAMSGEKGVDYTVNAEGKWSIIENNNTMDSKNSVILSGGMLPWYSPVEFELSINDEQAHQTFLGMKQLGEIAKLPFPYYTLSQQNKQVIQPMQKELATYVDESLVRFVIGEWPLDEATWNSYINGFNERNLQEFLSFWQNIYDQRQG